MDTEIARLEAEIHRLRADIACAKRELRALSADLQSTRTELWCMSLRNSGREPADAFRTAVITLIVIMFVLLAATWRSLGGT